MKKMPARLKEEWYTKGREHLRGKMVSYPVLCYLKFRHSNDQVFLYFSDHPKKLALFLIAQHKKNLGEGEYAINSNSGRFIHWIWRGKIYQYEIDSVRETLAKIRKKSYKNTEKTKNEGMNFVNPGYLENNAENLDIYENGFSYENAFSRDRSGINQEAFESVTDDDDVVSDLKSFFMTTREE